MKRTISLIIAIAVMVTMLIVPVSAAEQVIDMSVLDVYNFPAAGLNDVYGFHFATGGTQGNSSLGTLDLSGYNSMIINYRNGCQPGDSVADIALSNSAGETVGVLATEGTGGWGVESTGYIDISGVTSTSDTYKFELLPGANGTFITGVTLSTEEAPAQVITNAASITAGETKLTNNITGSLTASSGNYVIDLAGKTWSASTTVALNVNGANVKVIDTVGGGKIIVTANDAVEVNSGTFTGEGITIISDNSGGDALFVNGGTTIVKDCTLYAKKAGIDVSQNGSSAAITVDGGTFAGTYSTAEERTCAIEFRNNTKTVLLKNDITFTNNLIIRRSECTTALTSMISAGENSTISYGADSSVTNYTNYVGNTINYTYSVPVVEEPAFEGASITLTTGITVNFYAKNVDADAYVMINGEIVTGVASGENYVYSYGNFGPQQMGEEFTAELYVDDIKVDEKTYSIKEYLYNTIADTSSSTQLSNVCKDLLNYGAEAQKYKNYKTDALVNSELSADDQGRLQSVFYNPGRTPTIDTSCNIAVESVFWKGASVYFGDTFKLAIRFTAGDTLYRINAQIDGTSAGVDYTEFEDLGNGEYRVIIEPIAAHQVKKNIWIYAYDADGTQISDKLTYAVDMYIEQFYYESYAISGLVKSLHIYANSVNLYLDTL